MKKYLYFLIIILLTACSINETSIDNDIERECCSDIKGSFKDSTCYSQYSDNRYKTCIEKRTNYYKQCCLDLDGKWDLENSSCRLDYQDKTLYNDCIKEYKK